MRPLPAPRAIIGYFFKLYALTTACSPALDGPKGKRTSSQAIQGHVVGTGELVGTYRKSAS